MLKKVFVGLSGGVDSAVAAYLLKEQGYDVTCGFMRNWDSLANNDTLGNPTLDNEHCSQELDYQDALAVATQLGLPLLRVDFVAEYWDDVFSVFLEETKKGNTPNPDILCNRHIKFDAFFDFASKHGFDLVATGHYAKILQVDGINRLVKAQDKNKDQSYFLAQVPLNALQKALFPLQDLEKSEIRAIASQLDLPVATKRDSTGICFIGERHFREFLSNYLKETQGDIIDIGSNKKVGTHKGVMYYTLGQRHGLDISTAVGPFFVCHKDIETNTLYVTKGRDSEYLLSDKVIVNRINWYQDKDNIDCFAKFRYRQKDNPVTLNWIDDETLEVSVNPAVAAITPGQEAVFYDKDGLVLGAGRVDQIYYQNQSPRERVDQALENSKY
ncbi:MAG TPA: tRNA 2-thiouridine(34) synthase MnmA [Erysipelothrix sp.]|nr:tRNA 2-thiouridine(34) synthase MnmA [Erysipelothrix sp.]